MTTKTKFITITLIVAIVAFFLSNIIWPASPDLAPTASQVPFFIILSIIESLTFGIGVAFITLSWNRVTEHRAAFYAVSWLLISWWPHDNMHKHNGEDVGGILQIEYLFHVTLIIASYVIARYFWLQYHKVTGGAPEMAPT